MIVSTGKAEWRAGGFAMDWRNWQISGIRPIFHRLYVHWSIDVELTFWVNGRMIWPGWLEMPGVSNAWLKWSLFWLAVAKNCSERYVMVLLAPMG